MAGPWVTHISDIVIYTSLSGTNKRKERKKAQKIINTKERQIEVETVNTVAAGWFSGLVVKIQDFYPGGPWLAEKQKAENRQRLGQEIGTTIRDGEK